MRGRGSRARGLAACAALALLSLTSARAFAQAAPPPPTPLDYVVGIGDVLQISVWAHPELDRQVEVDLRGNILLPPVGEIKAAGLTTRQLGDRVADRLSTYLRQGAPSVTVDVREFNSQAVTVTGAVIKPGRYGAAVLPPLVTVLNMAGGAATNGDLSRVLITRGPGVAGAHQITADVAAAMRDGTEAQLPQLHAGDVIYVPVSISLVGGTGNGQAVGVLGDVGNPGLYPIGPDEDLWVALALAGGPRPSSNLATVKVLTTESTGPTVVTVNLLETLQKGNKQPYLIKPGDIIFVDSRGPSMWNRVGGLMATTRDVAATILAVRWLQTTGFK